MIDAQSIQWFPGHMAKTRRLMAANLKMVDIVVEITDARIPQSSRNPEIDRMLGQKPRLILLNKCDVADPNLTARWCEYYRSKGILAIPTDCKSGRGLNEIIPGARQVLDEVMKRREAKGLSQKLLRMMIVGIPNVGKSSLINKLAGSKRAKVEDRPGVTRGKQWVSIGGGVELLDMPGVLWPKFDDKEVGEKLAYIGSIKDEILDIEHLAMRFLQTVAENYPKLLCARYNLTPEEIDATYAKFLELADRKKEIHDYDLIYLTGDIDRLKKQGLSLKFLQVTTGTLVPTAAVVLKFGDRERMATATGNGPVDAAVSAIKQLIVERVVLTEFLMQAITRGSNDVGRVHVQVACGERTAHGFAAHTDTTRASVEAFLDALRSLDVTEKREEEE